MPDFGNSDSQGIGGTGCDLISFSERRRQLKRPFTNSSIDNEPEQLIARLKSARANPGKESRRRSCHGSNLARSRARQKATEAAAAAYRAALRHNGRRGKACEAALRAYLEISPNDSDASDQVVKAIILATADLTSKQ